MTDVPHEVLSEHFQKRMEGCRLVAAVFLTYQFDPGFFEQEVLPVFIDMPLSHVPTIRLLQLEDALRGVPGGIAVYYDANGLSTGDAGSARLDIRRIPIQHKKGIFHPKNAFVLIEDDEADEEGHRARSLVVASMSANLTRSGWWENVECCHVEVLQEGDRTRLKDDVATFLRKLRSSAPEETDHGAINHILEFLKSVEQRPHKSAEGRVHTHFYSGLVPLADFLDELVGRDIRRAHLEVISPYFDDRAECGPLKELVERFQPREVRVFLPRSAAGEALVRQELFEAVAAMENVQWSHLPNAKFLRRGAAEDAGERFVHAKVYRFFTKSPKREITFVGSANLTTAAHSRGGNVESGFLVDIEPDHRPDFWTTPDGRKPTAFSTRTEDAEAAASGGTPLNVRYHWDRAEALVFWDAAAESPKLRLRARDLDVGEIAVLPSRHWKILPADMAARIAQLLPETSLFEVLEVTGDPALLLVQEEGMSHKPSLLVHLSPAEILRYWSLLTPDQRAAFLEAHGPDLSPTDQGADLTAIYRRLQDHDTIFDRFAGFFHGFGCLERAVLEALEDGREKEADYRLFGRKYDSLGSLLDRIQKDREKTDLVDRYLMVLCARQLLQVVRRAYSEYWKSRAADVAALEAHIADLDTIRAELIESQDPAFHKFLDWFDAWFLKRAAAVEQADD
jgi:hypothetical protein